MAGMDWTDLALDRDRCECGNGTSGSIKCWEFIGWLRIG
jgi:hypothetical protein